MRNKGKKKYYVMCKSPSESAVVREVGVLQTGKSILPV